MVDGILEAEWLQRAAPGLRLALRLAVTECCAGLWGDRLGVGLAHWGEGRAHRGLRAFPAQ